MLGQMGQMYALKGAKQEFEGNEALREFYASGGDLSKAEDRQRLMSMAPMQGQKLIGQQSEISARDVKTQADSLKIIKDNVSLANNPQAMAEYLKGAYSTPGGVLLARLVPLDKALAAIPTDPKAFAEYQRNLGLTADKLYNSADSLLSAQVSREGHGVQMRGQNMTDARVREQLEFEKNRRSVIAMEGGYGQTDPYGNVYRVEGYGATRGPNALAAGPASSVNSGGGAPALSPTAANAFVTAKPSVNAFASTAPVSQPGAPTVANAAAIEAQQNIPRPPARAGYKYDQVTGNLVKVPDEKPVWNDKAQVWMTPPTAENPQGKVVEAPAVQEAVQKRTANATLKVAGYNPTTKTDEVSELIKQSTSGLGENWANKVWSAISGTGSKGAEAIGQLETRANEMTLALAPNGSLGAGFSNEDRTFMLGKLGDVANPNKPMNVRLAAWEDVMERTARNAGVPYTKQSLGSSTKSSPKVIQFGELPK
jgi:hypothetical protein